LKSYHVTGIPKPPAPPRLQFLTSPDWEDYELLDSGNGLKLERYGPYTFIRPEPQAVWRPALREKVWKEAHAVFRPTGEESGGRWEFHKPVATSWLMQYKDLRFRVQATAARHLGVFPEQAVHWDWMAAQIRHRLGTSSAPLQVLNLFGYTGLASLACAAAGGRVTHVDASKKAVTWARENASLSGMEDQPIRWIVDDALKFVRREARRGVQYDGLILDPPKFGRGPKGEVWEFFELFPTLLEECRQALSPRPLFVVITAYAIRASALSLHYGVQDWLGKRTSELVDSDLGGEVETGELALVEGSAGRMISTAIFTRWRAG
jgi:23S rRNA (cytosine1962-C5)-methyltransferase